MLKNFVKGIADAIRRKEGSTDLISPMDFAQRIDNLQVGGGTDESSIEYLDVSGLDSFSLNTIGVAAITVKGIVDGQPDIVPILLWSGNIGIPVALSVNFSTLVGIQEMGGLISIKDFLLLQGVTNEQIDSIPRITKEQFYDLTT